jgi:hypothetical protein
MKHRILLTLAILLTVLMLGACSDAEEVTPTDVPVVAEVPIDEPTEVPTEEPTEVPTEVPTELPTEEPTPEPTVEPTPSWIAPDGALVAIPATNAPTLDGSPDDAIWADATAIEVEIEDGANDADGVVSIKSAYTDDMVYFLVTWEDPTQSYMRSPWVKQDDGSWAKLTDPDDRGGDNNVYYEDKLSFIWPIDNSIDGFENKGCYTACHSGEDSEFKPYGNKYTDEEGQLGDIWHWKSVRNVNQVDDQYLDWTQYSAETPGAGRHGDPKDDGGYVNNETEDKSLPAFMGPEGYPIDGAPGYIRDGEQLPFDDSLFVAGDMIPGVITAPFTGDRGNISAGWEWVDGVWTLEIGRDLVTGSDYDVQFDDLNMPYYFGAAIFDNAQVRHAYQFGANEFVFQPVDGMAFVPAPVETEASGGSLVSMPATEAPTLDGFADDAMWADAMVLEVEVEDGANDADGTVAIKSVYTDDMIYFLVTWNDPTESFTRSPWVKQEDGSWAKLSDPDDRGGDNNVYYEDKLSFIWPIDNSIPEFEEKGCYVACHSGEDSEFKPYGNKYTDAEGQLGDIWHWKSVRNVNQLDDQYLDWTQYSADTPGAGRHSDPKEEGGYVANESEDKTLPAFMGPAGYPTDGSPGFILDGDKLTFDDSMFVAGDLIPGIVKSAFVGDRGDLSAGWHWEDGVWTLEIGRALVTDSDYDVQFSDLTAPYYFGAAIFDNAQVRHAYQFGVNELTFAPAE